MFEILDRRTSLTGNQIKILTAAIIGDALEFFDYFLIGFVLAFLIGPWKLTFGQSAIVLMSSGIGAIIGAYAWGWLADRIGRRPVFIGTVLNFSIATGLLYFTPDNGWIYLTILRFFVGTGVGGLYCVDLPLVQEFMPSSKRGWVGGLVTCVIPLGVGLGAVLGAFMGSDQWRLLFAIGVLPSLLVLLVRVWVPESPRWLCRQGRYEEARKSLAWALQVEPSSLPLPTAADAGPVIKTNWLDLFKYPRSLIVSWLGNAGAQTGVYGVTLWAPSLFVLLLKVTPQEAAKMMIALTVSGFIGRLSFSYFSEVIGRRSAGGLLGMGAGILIIIAGYNYDATLFGVSAFWLILIAAFFFADGGFAIVGPYAAEIWPSHLRTTGMGSAYGFGGIGKIIGPVGLALIVGSGNYLKPDVPLTQIPTAFLYLGCWFLMAGAVYYFLGIETRGKSIEQIDRELNQSPWRRQSRRWRRSHPERRERTNATRRTAALHHRTAGSRAHQELLCRRARARDRRSPAARFPRLLALFRRPGHRAPDGHAQAARRHRRARHREEVRDTGRLDHIAFAASDVEAMRKRLQAKQRQIPREHRAAHRRYAVLPLRSRRRRRGAEFPEAVNCAGARSTAVRKCLRLALCSTPVWPAVVPAKRVSGDARVQHLLRKTQVPQKAATRPSVGRESVSV